MPDRYGEDPAIDLPDAEWSAAQRRNAINACDRCDDDGLADGFQCDHQDHETPCPIPPGYPTSYAPKASPDMAHDR